MAGISRSSLELVNLYWFPLGGRTGLRVKTSDGRWRDIEGFPPYFFVPAGDGGAPTDAVGPGGERLARVEAALPSDVPKLRERYRRTYEADVPYVRRYLVDKRFTVSASPRVLYYDIEVVSKGVPDPANPTGRLASVACVDAEGREYFICETEEAQIFAQFEELLRRYDLAVGFNSGYRAEGEGFDLPYLVARAGAAGFRFNHRVASWGDLRVMYRKSLQRDTGSLADLCESVLGRRLEKPASRARAVSEWFERDRSRLREYNLADARALREIDARLGLVRIFCEIAHEAGVPYSDAHSPFAIVDTLVLREAGRRSPRVALPTGGAEGEDGGGLAGGLVLRPKPGLWRDVWVYDFRATYPSLLMTFNIGPDTVGGDIKTEVLSYRSDRRSILASAVERVVERRLRAKEAGEEVRSSALKIIANAFIGVLGNRAFRLHDRRLFESVTLTQRAILGRLRELAEARGATVLGGDTDATIVDRRLDVAEVNAELKEWILSTYGVPEHYYRIELEERGRYLGAFFPAEEQMKRYVLFSEEGMEVKGFELVRRNAPALLKRVEREVFAILRESLLSGEDYRRRVAEYRDRLRRELMSGALDAELVVKTGVREDLGEYKAVNSPPAKALRRLLELGAEPSETIEYVIADVRDGLRIEPVLDGRMPEITAAAREHYWESYVLPTLERMLGPLQQSRLEEWLG